jgi:hypothetical protein
MIGLFFTGLAGAALPLAGCGSRKNSVRHILPTVTPNALSVSVSLEKAAEALMLSVDGLAYAGRQTDTEGRFWAFDVPGLTADTTYTLSLVEDDAVIEPDWQLKTFPDRDSMPTGFRLMTYTCAGGADGFSVGNKQFFKPHAFRRKLFDQGLAEQPDAVIANGDHLYYDLKGQDSPPVGKGFIGAIAGWYLRRKYGAFDRTKPIMGTVNETTLKTICDEQIADLYGTRFKSVPVFFVPDDHDYFEDDDANEDIVTFPPDDFSVRANKAIADLYYPPLPEAPSVDVNRKFGILRYGKLFEAPLFDCAGLLTVSGDEGSLVPQEVEDWIVDRISSSEAVNFALVPSHPMGWTAGKWREWYPDVVAPDGFTGTVANVNLTAVKGMLTTKAKKYMWPMGWWEQHQRLLRNLSERPGTRFMFSGDIHAQGAVEIQTSGDLVLDDNPVTSVVVGPVSSSDATWPSSSRSVAAATPEWLEVRDIVDTKEVNGFAIMDVTSSGTTIRLHDCGGYDRSLNEDGRTQRVYEFNV